MRAFYARFAARRVARGKSVAWTGVRRLTPYFALHIVARMNPQISSLRRARANQGRSRKARLAAWLSMCLAPACFAAHWQEVGPANGSSIGLVYMDLDSVHDDQGYRVAVFLTIYASSVPNAHGIKLDRITQETAFNCGKREFALLETIGYFDGKKVGGSSAKEGDWKERARVVPQDPFSQRALDLACNAPVARQPEATPMPSESPGSIRLPGPNGVVKGGPALPSEK